MMILLLLMVIAALPILPAYLWVRFHKLPITSLWFLLSLLAGAVSLLLAALLQILCSPENPQESTLGNLLFNIFIRIALTEETGRLLALGGFFWLGSRFKQIPADPAPAFSPLSFGAATGLLAGLGFAILETASYGAMNLNMALLRAFTAAPLHGACGIRIGMGAIMLKQTPIIAAGRFLSAVILHGMYNFMVISPGIPRVFPIVVAFLALFSSIQGVRAHSA